MLPEDDNANYRICDNCGEIMYDGYILDRQHACCDECALALYNGNAEELRRDLDEEMDYECCYVDCF